MDENLDLKKVLKFLIKEREFWEFTMVGRLAPEKNTNGSILDEIDECITIVRNVEMLEEHLKKDNKYRLVKDILGNGVIKYSVQYKSPYNAWDYMGSGPPWNFKKFITFDKEEAIEYIKEQKARNIVKTEYEVI